MSRLPLHWPLRLLGTVLAALLALALLAVVPATPAWAHTRLVSSTPAQGQPVAAPAEVVLVFNDPVQGGLSAMSVRGANGEEHASGPPGAGADGTSVAQALHAPLEPGTYTVAYRVLAADGHPVTGSFDITAAPSSPTSTPAAGSTPTAPAPTTAPPPGPTPAATTGALSPAAGSRQGDGGLPVLPLVVGGLVVAGIGGLLVRRLGGAPPSP